MANRYSDAGEASSLSALLSFVLKGGRGRAEPAEDAPWFDNFGARSSRLRVWRRSSLRGSRMRGSGLRDSHLAAASTASAAGSSANSSSAAGSTFLSRRAWARSSSAAAPGAAGAAGALRGLVPSVSVFGCFGAGVADADAPPVAAAVGAAQ